MELAKEHQQLLTLLVYRLKEIGYPEDCFAVEYSTKKYRVDLAIINPVTKQPMQFFELKSTGDARRIDIGRLQVKRYMEGNDYDIPAYLVYPNINNNDEFVIEKYSKTGDFELLENIDKNVPDFNFDYLLLGNNSSTLNKEKEKRNNVIDVFKIICWVFAFILAGLIFLDKIKCICLDLTLNDIIVIGIITGLTILPFTKRLKILNFEIDRLEKEEDK